MPPRPTSGPASLRIPATVRAVVVGLTVGLLGVGSWSRLVGTNLTYWSDVPWAVPAMAVVLVLWWQYFVSGWGGPASTQATRRRLARAHPVPVELWGPALGTGMLGLIGVLLLQGVLGRLVALPQQQEIDPSQFPTATVFAWMAMSAVVAGVVEETTFRGYIQGEIERHHGLALAILVSGMIFGVMHFTHPEVGLVLLTYYVAVAAVYGGVTYATNSTYPSMVLHAGGNIWSAFGLLAQGRSEWDVGTGASPLVWESGVDGPFVAVVVAFAVVGTAVVMSFRGLVAAGRTAGVRSDGVLASVPGDGHRPPD